MSQFFATNAAHILVVVQRIFVGVFAHIFVVFGLMLSEFAAGLVLAPLTTTPPHLTAPVRLMSSTTPIKVLLFTILFSANLTGFHSTVKLAFSINELLNTNFHFFLF
jgi:hypothetical protein